MMEHFCKNVPPKSFDWVSKYVFWQYCQKNRHLKDIILFLYSYHVHPDFVEQTKKKRVTVKEKDLTFEDANLSIGVFFYSFL